MLDSNRKKISIVKSLLVEDEANNLVIRHIINMILDNIEADLKSRKASSFNSLLSEAICREARSVLEKLDDHMMAREVFEALM